MATAVELADRDGLDGLSMRRLADDLGVTPMAIYKHLEGRDRLLDAMVDRVVADIAPVSADGFWKADVRGRILAARAATRRHAWMQSAIESRAAAGPAVLAHMDALMASMFAGGLSADLVHHAMHALSTRMWGFTRDVLPTPTAPVDPAAREAALAAFAEHYPAIVRMATTAPDAGESCDTDAEFVFALDLLLDGVERLHASGWSSI